MLTNYEAFCDFVMWVLCQTKLTFLLPMLHIEYYRRCLRHLLSQSQGDVPWCINRGLAEYYIVTMITALGSVYSTNGESKTYARILCWQTMQMDDEIETFFKRNGF